MNFSLFLETLGKPLPESIEDGEKIGLATLFVPSEILKFRAKMGVANEKRSPDSIPNFLDKVGLSLALSPAISIPFERTYFLPTTLNWIHTEIPAFFRYLEKCHDIVALHLLILRRHLLRWCSSWRTELLEKSCAFRLACMFGIFT